MQKITHFSKHARARTYERTAISKQEVALLLDKKLYISVGKTPGIHKEYLVFYSPPDALCYLAVRNPLTGAVITIMPTRYQECTGWNVTDEMCRQVRDMTMNSPLPELEQLFLRDHKKHDEIQQLITDKQNKLLEAQQLEKARKKQEKIEKHLALQKVLQQPKFELKLLYIDEEQRHKMRVIGKIPAEKYGGDFQRLLGDADFYSMLDDMLAKKNVTAHRYIRLIINIGKNDAMRSHITDF